MFRITMLPAEDGDCLLIETGEDATPHRILIDGGRKRTSTHLLPRLLASLRPQSDPLIDVLALTHIDADHIEGFLSLREAIPSLKVGDVWFNGGPQMEIVAGLRPTPPSGVSTLGVAQAVDFGSLIAEAGWRWNARFAGAPIEVKPNGPLPRLALPSGAELTLLGPSHAKLYAFRRAWKTEFARSLAGQVGTLRGGPRPIPRPGTVEEIAILRDAPDTAGPNGTSIAFVIDYRGKRALFAADAHPDDVAGALTRYLPGGGPARFDAVKVAHHGSAANNTSQLIGRLEAPLWLVSSSGARHGHPDPEAIARIVLAGVDGKRLVFNYKSAFNDVWSPLELIAQYRYRPEYGDGGSPVVVDLL